MGFETYDEVSYLQEILTWTYLDSEFMDVIHIYLPNFLWNKILWVSVIIRNYKTSRGTSSKNVRAILFANSASVGIFFFIFYFVKFLHSCFLQSSFILFSPLKGNITLQPNPWRLRRYQYQLENKFNKDVVYKSIFTTSN